MARRDEDELKRIVSAVVRAARVDSAWDRARFPDPGLVHVFAVDGWLSSGGSRHLAEEFALDWRRFYPLRLLPLRAFSYTGSRETYGPWDTHTSIDILVDRFIGAILSIEQHAGAQYAMVTFSLGGVIALLALGRLLQIRGPAWVRAQLPMLVVVQPPLGGSPEIARLLDEDPDFLYNMDKRFSGGPSLVWDLERADSELLGNARKALVALAEAMVPISVITVGDDAIAPPADDWPGADARIEWIHIEAIDAPAQTPFRRHFSAIRGHPKVTSTIVHRMNIVLAPLLDP